MTFKVQSEIFTRSGLLVKKEKTHWVMIELTSNFIRMLIIKCGRMVLDASGRFKYSSPTLDETLSLLHPQCFCLRGMRTTEGLAWNG